VIVGVCASGYLKRESIREAHGTRSQHRGRRDEQAGPLSSRPVVAGDPGGQPGERVAQKIQEQGHGVEGQGDRAA
jgi:hypothetical protein